MNIEETNKYLTNVSIFLKRAILELQNIPCGCTKENDLICTKCALLSDIKNIRHDVNAEISKIIK